MNKAHERTLWLIRACAIWLVGLGVYFIVVRPSLLPEDARFMGATQEQIAALLPGLQSWLQHVFTVMGGFMTGTGVLVFAAAPQVARTQHAGYLFALAGIASVGVMSAVNFSLHSDFRWLLLAPVVLWIAAVVAGLSSAGGRP